MPQYTCSILDKRKENFMNNFKRELLKEKAHAHYEYGYCNSEEKEAYFKLLDKLCDSDVMIISKSKLKEKLRVEVEADNEISDISNIFVNLPMCFVKGISRFILTPEVKKYASNETKNEFVESFEQEFDPNEGEVK
jgi:hypothetical protein